MAISRSLLLKCLGGVAACFGTASLGFLGSETFGFGNVSSESETELNELLEKVGLTRCTTTDSGSNECDIGSLKVKQGDNKEESKTKDTSNGASTGKIKVYSDSSYENKFKFLIEDGDISLTGGTNSQTITKLEQFETYEIKEEGSDQDKKWYFSRKTEAKDEIKKALGLPSGCTLDDGCSEVEVDTSTIASMKFVGLSSNQTATLTGTVTLTVTKETPSDDFPFGYKFTFKGKDKAETLTINGNTITLQQNTATEFRIKKSTGNNITLEEAWTKERLLEKVGLECNGGSSNECTQKSGKNINIKFEDNDKLENKTLGTSNVGKIKLYTGDNATGYNKGFKFVIEEKDISITGESTKKLEQFETYEIKKDETGDKWYLTRKDKAGKGIKTALGLPDDCNLTDNGCSEVEVTTTNIGQIKFDGLASGQSASLTGSQKLTVSKVDTTDSDFPFGYKFTFKSESADATIKISNSKSITIKANTGTEFRIKKSDTGNNITLEEAWTKERLLEKVGLECNGGSSNECTQKSGQTTNIKQESTTYENKTIPASDSSSGSGKIKLYTTGTDGYNQGFKFVIESGDITVDSGSSQKLEQFETYEIKKDETDSKWYLTRKEKAADEIKRLLELPSSDSSCTLPTSENSQTNCSNISGDQLKAINFVGKGNNQSSITSGGTVNLTITKTTTDTTTFPLGYKFAFDPTEEVTISSSNKIAKKSGTEFKIKVTPSSGTTPVKLSLEKAWTAKSLGEKVGLNCPDPSGGGEKKCSFTDNKINVNNGNGDSKIENAKVKDDASGKKMTYEEDKEGYNQGFKFYLEENEDITLTNGSGSDSGSGDKKINKKSGDNGSGDTTYEIKKDESDSKWYLTKYTPTSS